MLYSYTTVQYGKYAAWLTFAAIVLTIFLSGVFIETDPKEAIQLLWILVATGIFLVYSYIKDNFMIQSRINPQERARIFIFTIVGFAAVVFMMAGLQLTQNLTSRYTILIFPAFGILSGNVIRTIYVSIAAIFEENLRFAASRFIEQFEFSFPFISVGQQGQRYFVTLLVNLIWSTYHVRSYVGATLVIWVGLFFAGILMSVMMNLSGHVLVAMLIHLAWNLMVVL